MALPKIAIVGRPNVGKSSLLNRLAGRRVSIVDPTPGVTRDRISVWMEIEPPLETPKGTPSKFAEIVDTGGYGVYTVEGERFDDIGRDLTELTGPIEQQIIAAWEEAQVILFVVDAQAGITALDETVARLLREHGCQEKVLPVASKVDGETWTPHGLEAAAFGLGEPICVSATTGFGLQGLLDAVYERIDMSEEDDRPDNDEVHLAIVGKRNSGKSTLINALAGSPRVIVSEIAGTTRDSVDVRFEIEGRVMVAIDTAGVRKRKSIGGDVEFYAYHRMLGSIRRSDVAIMLIDATEEISQVDKKLSEELQRQFKPTVIVVNKCDLVPDLRPEDYLQYLTEQLRGHDYAPIVFISASSEEGLLDLAAMAFNLREQARHRETTGQLNRVVEDILKRRGPSSRLGTQHEPPPRGASVQRGPHPPGLLRPRSHVGPGDEASREDEDGRPKRRSGGQCDAHCDTAPDGGVARRAALCWYRAGWSPYTHCPHRVWNRRPARWALVVKTRSW